MTTSPATTARPTPPPAAPRPARRPRIGAPLIGLVLVPSLLIALVLSSSYFVLLPLLPAFAENYFVQQAETYTTYRIPLYLHIAGGTVALILGAINVVTAVRGRRLRAHAVLGRIYTVAIAIAATAGFFLAFHAYAGILPGGRFIVTSGFATLAIVWLGTLALAVHAMAVKKDVARHRFWIIVNFALTFAAVTLRIWIGAFTAAGGDVFDLLYPTLGWVGWVPNLVVGLLIARRLTRRNPIGAERRALAGAAA